MSRKKPPAKKSEKKTEPSLYVGIGASAGGLEAIDSFFTRMPPDSGMSFIVVQHLSPDHKSLMVELLSRRTRMPVHRAQEGMQVEPDRVYLIPPKKNMTIFHGKLLLRDQEQDKGINLPVDIFFKSLAEDQGEKAVGIVLSGSGSDGTRGVKAVKEAGGMIMVQEESSARFDSMPRSALATGLADFVLRPEDMPGHLLEFARAPHTSLKRPDPFHDDDGLTRILALLRERTRVDFTHYKMNTIVRRLERRMTINKFEELEEYLAWLESNPGEIVTLYKELLIGVTSFFRDPDSFSELREKWLPGVVEGAQGREVRFWCAGCSTGEEAYTLAMLARETADQLGVSCSIKVFATDIDRDAVMKAGAGVYPDSIAADIPADLLSRYFHRKEDGYQVARTIRESVVFAQHNLIKDPPFTGIDIVSCRNLLIYLQPVLQKKVIELFNFSLRPGGVLFLGNSETIGDMDEYFEHLHQKHRIFRTRGRRRDISGSPDMDRLVHKARRYPPKLRESWSSGEERMLERLLQTLSGEYLPVTLVVNEGLEVLHVLGDTEGYFKLPSGKMMNDISKMAARDLAIPLATGIQKAFKSGSEMRYANVRLPLGDQIRVLDLVFKPLPAKQNHQPLVAVLIEETEVRKKEAREPEIYDLGREAHQRIKDLEHELQFTRENLQATIEELETANEELQATNEELISSNEELESTNEELQSVNEELYTVNAEYQSKIIELTELTNDLDNLLTSTKIGTLFLDENLEIRKFTPQVSQVFKILDSDIGRPLDHLTHCLVETRPCDIIRQVQRTSEPAELEVQTTAGFWFLMRIVPYHIGPEAFSGLVVTFIDINQVKEAQEALLLSEGRLARTTRLAKVGSWAYDPDTGVQDWSEETFRILDLEPPVPPSIEEMVRYFTPEFIPRVENALHNARSAGTPFDLVCQVRTGGKGTRWVRIIGQPDPAGGQPRKVRGAVQDVTSQKQVEEKLSWELSVNRALAGLSGALISTEHSLEDIPATVLGYARSLTGSEHGYVSVIDPETGNMVSYTLTAMMGKECRVEGEQKRIVFPISEDGTYPCLWGVPLNSGASFFSNDPAAHPATRGVPEGHIPLRRFLAVPVLFEGLLVGQIALANAGQDYTERDAEAIERIATLYALALHRERIEDEIRAENEGRKRELTDSEGA